MKNLITPLLLLCFVSQLIAQKNIIGTWEGKLGNIRIVFHFEQKDNMVAGTFDSPDQKAIGLPISSVTMVADSIFATIGAPKAAFNALLANDTTLVGNWIQGTAKVPLTVIKKSNNSTATVQQKPQRSQTPKPPFSYLSDSVEYDNADKTVHLGATFTRPKTDKKYPVAVLITGSGQEDRDETIFGHHPFAVIADYLTKNGYAVLRVDDRQMGQSKGDLTKASTQDFADDVITSINYLKTRNDVDIKKIGLIGHSEGGMIAPIVYSKWPQVAFIISLAGTGISGEQILLPQLTNPFKQGVSEAAFNGIYQLTKKQLSLINNAHGTGDSALTKSVITLYDQWKIVQPDTVLKALQMEKMSGTQYADTYGFLRTYWFRYFIETDPSIFWQTVKCPVLALNGSKDIQVYPNQNIPAITAALKKAGNKNVTTQILPGLNHLFQHCKTCTGAEYEQLDETFSPEVLTIMSDWLKKNVVE